MRVDFLEIRQGLAPPAVVHGKHAVAEVGLGVLRVCLHRFVRVAQRVLGLALRVAKRVLRDTRESGIAVVRLKQRTRLGGVGMN